MCSIRAVLRLGSHLDAVCASRAGDGIVPHPKLFVAFPGTEQEKCYRFLGMII